MIYQFRHDRDITGEILARIKRDKQLSQGWGGGKEADLDLRGEDFINRTVVCHKLATTRTPSNLTRMKEFKNGDMLVVPHLPEYGKVSVHIVKGDFPSCYHYDASDDTYQNHRISLKDSFGLQGEISIYNEGLLDWYAKLAWLRYPVLAIPQFEKNFSDVIKKMQADPSKSFDPSGLSDFLNKCSKQVGEVLTEKLRGMPAAGGEISFESVCERLLIANGYEIVARNQYNNLGGDTDRECRRSRRDTSIFEGGDVTLAVQIKKHEGMTDETAVNQVLGMIQKRPEADGCVMSAADGFTPEAKRLADDNGIVLIDRHQICVLLMSLLSKGVES